MQQEIIDYMAIGISQLDDLDIEAARYQAEVMLEAHELETIMEFNKV